MLLFPLKIFKYYLLVYGGGRRDEELCHRVKMGLSKEDSKLLATNTIEL